LSVAFAALHSARVSLRRVEAADAGAISGYRSLPEVARFQSWTAFDADTAARMIADQAALAADTPGTWFQLVIVRRDTEVIIGDLALHFLAEDDRQVEIGINLAPDQQRQGYAAEAIGLALAYVFGTLGKHRVFAVTDAENAAAAQLFHRLGFRREGHFIENIRFKGAYGSEYLFAMLAREWIGRERR
ncbi:MAG: GNAT family protein, partial [Aliidongia sp.]